MDDTISRRAAIDSMCSACGYDCDTSEFVYDAPIDKQVIICPEHYALSTLPSVQRSGKWIYQSTGIYMTSYKCSECGRHVVRTNGYDVAEEYPYCHCGAKMS